MTYLAHITADGRKQTIEAHLRGTAARCAAFAAAFGAEAQGELAGMAHDIGKYSQEFQKRLLDNGPRVDHATAGACECHRRKQLSAAFAVMGHHSGLPNLGSDNENGSYQARLKGERNARARPRAMRERRRNDIEII